MSLPSIPSRYSLLSRRLSGIAVTLLLLAIPLVSQARVEQIRWDHTDASQLASFRVYVRDVAGSYGPVSYEGLPTPDTSGVYRLDLTVADDRTIVVAIAAYDGQLESALSNEKQFDGLVVPPPPPAPGTTYRLNAGGGSYTDSLGQVWSPDSSYAIGGSTGFNANIAITGTPDPDLYRSWRNEPNASTTMRYELPVPDGRYRVRLHAVETWDEYGVGDRLFDVEIEGALVLIDHDLIASSGLNRPDVSEFDVDVSDGSISIAYRAKVNYPTVAALEVAALGTGGGTDTGGGGTGGGTDTGGGGTGGGTDTGGGDTGGGTDTGGGDTGGGGTLFGAPGKPTLVTD